MINIEDNGNIVRRSARIRNNNSRNVSYAKGNSKFRSRGAYNEYVKVRKILLAKPVSGNMTTAEGIKKLGYVATKAIVAEIQQLVDKDVLEGRHIDDLSLYELRKIITCRMFLREKTNVDGIFEKVKARLVAGGHLQDRDIYNNGSSPTASTTVVFIEAALAAKYNNSVAHIGFSGAFLNADMPTDGDHVVHMRLNKFLTSVLVQVDGKFAEFVEGDGTIVCRLNKALYGTIEAARLWYDTFVKDAVSLGYKVNEIDMCVFRRTESDGSVSVLVLHVDDLFIRASSEVIIDKIIDEWNTKYPGVTQHRGKKIEYLGMMFDFSIDGEVTINQNGFVNKLLSECADMSGESYTPHKVDLFNVDDKLQLIDNKRQELFHSRVQSLLYLAKRTRPDIQTAVGFLGRRVKKANEEDWTKLGKVIRFIRKTSSVGLRFRLGVSKLKVTAFVDVSYASHADCKSHTGSCIYIGDFGAVYCKSTRQSINTKSSSESELVGVTDLAGAYIWIRNYLRYQEYDMDTVVDVRQDNKAVLAWLKNGRARDEKGRHISIRYFWLCDRIKRGNICVNYTNTKDMVADYLSKPLVGAIFDKFRNMILGISTWIV